MCHSVSFFRFTLLTVPWASWMFTLMYFIIFGKFSTIIFSKCPLSAAFPLSSPPGTPTTCVGPFDGVQWPHRLFTFLHSFFFLLLSHDHVHCLTFKCADSFFCLLKSAFDSPLVIFFSFQLYFSAPEFLFRCSISFCYIHLLTHYFLNSRHVFL